MLDKKNFAESTRSQFARPRRTGLPVMPSDPLTIRLDLLNQNDLKTILLSGLKVDEEVVFGKSKEVLIRLLSKELRAAASSSTVGLRRDEHEFPYKQILIDVADKLAPGYTALSWTKYKLEDAHTVEEIEEAIAAIFEEKARKWWSGLSEEKKSKFSNDIEIALKAQGVGTVTNGGAIKDFAIQQVIENLIQTGIMNGIGSIAAKGVLGGVGVTLIGQVGWLILLQTVGWMGGIKIALFGIGGYGAAGGGSYFHRCFRHWSCIVCANAVRVGRWCCISQDGSNRHHANRPTSFSCYSEVTGVLFSRGWWKCSLKLCRNSANPARAPRPHVCHPHRLTKCHRRSWRLHRPGTGRARCCIAGRRRVES